MRAEVIEHNKEVRYSAETRAAEMDMFPSPLEAKMKEFLCRNHVRFESQRIFYIYGENGWIMRYYIADFYIPGKEIIIEVDGKFHDQHKQHDKERTKIIQKQYPVEVLRYQWKDLQDEKKMQELLDRIK